MATPRKHPDDYLPRGRPCEYSQEIADKICDLIATHTCGYNTHLKNHPELPLHETVTAWRLRFPAFSAKYMDSKRFQSDLLAEETLTICDELETFEDDDGVTRIDSGRLGKAKLQISTRQWHAAKLQPKIYGERQQIEELQGENDRVKAELAELRSKLDKANVSEY